MSERKSTHLLYSASTRLGRGEKENSRFHNGYPIFGGSLARTHTCFRRSYCKRFVGKDTYPDLSTTTRISCHCSSPCFYLFVLDLERFQQKKVSALKCKALSGMISNGTPYEAELRADQEAPSL
ncbi:hypothetical protein KSP39_PZI023644 [Platanthera zijinensis]|uniref:Uncharacterized protein n=1 Tax=Platanthera zijinensis TaxID=2320716 RepID=A0AAP0ATW9_9ASPA